MERTLYALLVAINNYDQQKISDLKGCITDLNCVAGYLDHHCQSQKDIRLVQKVLTDEQATRSNLIEGFKLFDRAQDGDICLFYFSGHGAQIDAPAEFDNEPGRKLEALVCRAEKGNDNLLIDKELSFLIAQATAEKDVHFVVISDSCHSGSNTKAGEIAVRSVPDNLNRMAVDDYYGRAAYQQIQEESGRIIKLQAPIGKHIKLSACTRGELAKEMQFGESGPVRGIFTFALLEVLKHNGNNLSYANLLSKTRLLSQSLVKDQSPQIEAIRLLPQEQDRLFLDGSLGIEPPGFQLSFLPETSWTLHAGSILGITIGDQVILPKGQTTTVTEVRATHSLVDPEPLTRLDEGRSYQVTIVPDSRSKLNLAISGESEAEAARILVDLMAELKPPYFEINPNRPPQYLIRAVAGCFALTYPESRVPAFSRVERQDRSGARLFLSLVDKVAQWHYRVNLRNPLTSIEEAEIGINLRVVGPGQLHENPDASPETAADNWREENVFRYYYNDQVGGPWHAPAFRLSIKNLSTYRPLWVSALYCGGGYLLDPSGTNYQSTVYSITNRFLPKEQLKPEDQVDLIDEFVDLQGSFRLTTIPLTILDDYFDQGYNEIKDIVKLLVCTEEFDTTSLNMNGIPIDTRGELGFKPMGLDRLTEEQPDWRTFEIPITIVKPRDLGTFDHTHSKTFAGITLQGHPYFSARVILSTMEEFIRSSRTRTDDRIFQMPRPEICYGQDLISCLPLSQGLGQVEACQIIELFRSTNLEAVTGKDPLVIALSEHWTCAPGEQFAVLGYSEADRQYRLLGVMTDDRQIRLSRIPPPSRSLIDGLGNSVKLICCKATLQELKLEMW